MAVDALTQVWMMPHATGADGWEGLPNAAPFHFIHVGAAAEEPPQALMDQVGSAVLLFSSLSRSLNGWVNAMR